jgi:4-hydroxy-3-polyprenylbenzoate decarboxylase
MKQIVLGITGASGAAYSVALAKLLAAADCQVHLVVTPHGRELLKLEQGIANLTPAAMVGKALARRVTLHDYHRQADPLASGSVHTDGMAVCPCSSNTLAAIAAGLADNLLTRAAMVHLKQRRPLVLATREMPVSAIDLGNQLRLSQAGAIIAPASPGFYHNPKSIQDLVDFVAARIADCLGCLPPQTRGKIAYGNL